MGFKVFQGQVADGNRLAVSGKSQVYVLGNDKFRLTPPDEKGGKGAKPPSQPADEVVVIINEQTTGREVFVVWDPSDGTPPVAVPRTQPVTVGAGTGDWLVTPDHDNIDDSKIDGAYQAKVPSGWQAAAQQVKFTTSMCGLDAFIVTFRSLQSGKPKLAHVIVRVRKRIQCHLFEMKRSAAADAGTHDEYRGPLGTVQTFFADKFGIDLVFPGDGKIVPEGPTPFFATRTTSQLNVMIAAAHAPGRLPTHLWINVVHAISGTIQGWGGSSMASVETKDLLDSRRDWEKWVKSWQDYEKSQPGFAYAERWVTLFNPPLRGADREVALQLAGGQTTPGALFHKQMRNLLLHEIGHAFGLVPTNEEAGGIRQGSWLDSGHQNHCNTNSCVMFFEGDSAQLGTGLRIGEEEPFDHGMENCRLFLRACDLSDIRRLPK